MKSGRTLQELAAEITRQNNSKIDYTANTEKLTINLIPESAAEAITPTAPQNTIDNLLNYVSPPAQHSEKMVPVLEWQNGGIHRYGIDRFAHQQIASNLKIPWAYYDRMLDEQPDLLAANINRWFEAEPKRRLIRTLDGNVRAWLSNRYRPLDNHDLACAVLPLMQSLNMQVESCEVTPSHMYLKAIDHDRKAEIKGSKLLGDEVAAGIVISNSEVGCGSIKIQPLVYRLVCKNGLIALRTSGAGYRRNHTGRGLTDIDEAQELISDRTREIEDAALWSGIADIVRGSMSLEVFNRQIGAIESATARPITRPVDEVIQVVAKRFNLSDAEGSSVLDHLARGNDLSQWGLINAVTRASQDVESYERATELETMGGEIMELSAIDWSQIAEMPQARA